MYVEHTIQILREIRRVLRKDGVVFWNIGDSYINNPSNGRGKSKQGEGGKPHHSGIDTTKVGLQAKQLCLMPFHVAIAAQENGWWVRSVIIWNKPNPMPESVKDRPTESHEYILMLTKSARYYWDQEAVREPYQPSSLPRMEYPRYADGSKGMTGQYKVVTPEYNDNNGRNLRSVWTFPTQPYPEAHFAVFPEKLPEICIKAGSKEGDTILDPFAGAGTTLKVAAELNRKAIGYELSEEYCQLIIERNRQQILT